MASKNKSYRIRTKVGREADTFLDVHLDQDYDSLEILSLKISDKVIYKLHNSDYGVVVGRVLANGNFGVPNAKISVFIPADEQNSSMEMWNLYPYTSTSTKNDKNIRYNLLPDESVKDCHKAVGTFPNKTFLLDNDSTIEVFDKYYIYTTRTNASGDYLICGVPTGTQTLHMDLDLSDCGILSQRPRDFVYKGYTVEQFENPNQFKKDANIDGLSQIFSQNQPVYVKPFWGNEDNGDEIGITRADIEVAFKFEPTCVFMGSAISDNNSNGVGKKCVPTNQMGLMEELTAGEGTIEMIRKTPGGNVEEFTIKGNQLIDGNGVWCYQIPMNLDYMMTDEYGNMVPTDDPEKGIPTRTRVRFRASLTDMEDSQQSYYRAKYLIPNNPSVDDNKVDYNFGTYTDESSYRDLFWNGVYTVKSYIPRFQKSKRWKSERFSGIKACNYYGPNNPMPYNNLRIKLPFMFTVLCIIVKSFIKVVTIVNRFMNIMLRVFFAIAGIIRPLQNTFIDVLSKSKTHCVYVGDGLCPDMEGWYFAPACMAWTPKKLWNPSGWSNLQKTILTNTLEAAQGRGDDPTDDGGEDNVKSGQYTDETSIDWENTPESEEASVCLTTDIDYLLNCFEMALAQEYRVIKFDFYNDWVNGVIYFPRWMRKVKRKKKYKFTWKKITSLPEVTTYYKDKVHGCMNSENSTAKKSRYYTQQCSVAYEQEKPDSPYNIISSSPACSNSVKVLKNLTITPQRCHKQNGMMQSSVFGPNNGLVTENTTMLGQYVYYLKPCEWKDTTSGRKRTILFATDIVLLGTLNDCDENGIPQAFKYLNNSSYIMPTNLALTTMDDDSYIYSSPGGTVCTSTNRPETTQPTQYNNVVRITPDYETTYYAYSGTDGEQVTYKENDDPVPVTEAAGITWNYAGPGQDNVNLGKYESPDDLKNRLFKNKKKSNFNFLYYPGGHFLGLSCVNSETNIKSCVNLKRICELGATMSQRREEVRGYDSNGAPKYRYYVPTGLISNVDIESASFRSMFATINHNKLIATKVNDETGYKTYDFRFLRPDGFDGALMRYVHKSGSPYNQKVNTGDNEKAIDDASRFFKFMFGNTWSAPLDYDAQETEYTERRTVESSIDDYYMFRFGLNDFSDREQKKHFLSKNRDGLILPQYENSFYFYFGLKDGATALDEFKKQFFSECETNNVMKDPTLDIKESISDDLLTIKADVVINNMVGPYVVTLADNSLGITVEPFQIDLDVFDVEKMFNRYGPVTGYTLAIGREYTVTVTDSLDRTITRTFTFGETAVKLDASTVHFRFKVPETGTSITEPKKGGYVKVNDIITILGAEYSIDSETEEIDFVFRKITDGTEGQEIVPQTSGYTDADGQKWHLYYLSEIGKYNMYLVYNGAEVSVYTTIIEDNSPVNLYVSCDYLGYKADGNEPSAGLSALTETEWLNSASIFGGTSIESWVMRHSFYRQTQDDTAGYNNYIYTNDAYNLAIFGQPEKGDTLSTPSSTETDLELAELYSGGTYGNTFYKGDYEKYEGYSLDDRYLLIPTMYWSAGSETTASTPVRNTFDAMSYSDDGRAAADATDIIITDYIYDNEEKVATITYSGSASNLIHGHGCVVIFENGKALFPTVQDNSTMVAFSDEDIYPQELTDEKRRELLLMAVVYPTMMVPCFYRPFYGEVTGIVWNNFYALPVDVGYDEFSKVAVKTPLPTSYKVEGSIYNGLTFGKKFYKGTPYPGETSIRKYDTYMVLTGSPDFYNVLSANTGDDYKPKRKIDFGHNSWDDGFARDISLISEIEGKDVEDFDEVSYEVKEGIPTNIPYSRKNILTGRYEGEFDQVVLRDSCSISDSFYNDIQIMVSDKDSGLTGECSLYTEENEMENVRVYLTSRNLFTYNGPILSEFTYVGPGVPGYYMCGYFNQNAVYDEVGTPASVAIVPSYGDPIWYYVTNSQGEKERRFGNLSDLESAGITICLGSMLSTGSVRNNLVAVVQNAIEEAKITQGEDGIRLHHRGDEPGTYYTSDNIMSWNAIIQEYEKKEEGTKNKMTVYNLIPLRSIDVSFPSTSDGGEPILEATIPSSDISSTGGTETITVNTNMDFMVMCASQWVTISGGPNFSAGTNSVDITIEPNTGQQRRALVTLRSRETVILDERTQTRGYLNVNIPIYQAGNS